MWGAFYLGSRKQEDKLFEMGKNHKPESLDLPEEVSDEQYDKQIETWKVGYGKETVTNAG